MDSYDSFIENTRIKIMLSTTIDENTIINTFGYCRLKTTITATTRIMVAISFRNICWFSAVVGGMVFRSRGNAKLRLCVTNKMTRYVI